MAVELRKPIGTVLSTLPDRDEIRRRIAENIQERQLLRQLLRLAEQRQVVESVAGEGKQR